jgi:2-polyprenyl-3-methyl-5-hydroxy-6-metoxy-1,4-benzoquinol methylase
MGYSQSLNWASNKKVQQVYVKGSVESPIQKVHKFSVVTCLEVLPKNKGFS